MATAGAVRCRVGKEAVFYLPTGKAFSVTGTVREPRDLGFDITCHSRGLLEYCVRQGTLRYPNITFESDRTVQGVVCEGGHVRGVRYNQFGEPHALSTDFVVDAGGRKSQAARWLTELGFQAPEATTVGIDLAYASTKFRVPEGYDRPERLQVFIGPPPDFPNGAVMEIIEDQTWHVTLMGRFGDIRRTTRPVFSPSPRRCIAPSYTTSSKMPSEWQTSPPTGFPPAYGAIRAADDLSRRVGGVGGSHQQLRSVRWTGMSSAALQVQALQQALRGA